MINPYENRENCELKKNRICMIGFAGRIGRVLARSIMATSGNNDANDITI